MTDVSVAVEINGITDHLGVLFTHRRGQTESSTFSYDQQYVAREDAYAIDPELPLSTSRVQSRVGEAMFGALSDCTPDRWGRTLVKRREDRQARSDGRTPRQLGEVDYLLGVRDDLRQGALRFRLGRGDEGPYLAQEDSGVPALTDLPELMDLAARAEADTADLPDLLRLVRLGSSLGGARPKAHVRVADGTLAIAKFPSAAHDTWNVMAWEKVAHDLARSAGITVPRTTLLNLAGRSVLLIDRFDRRADGTRIGYLSAMTMLEASDGDQRSYLELADVVETTSDTASADLQQLWRRIVFSVLISNTDDHLRNHGFLHAHHASWRLAPAFDINPNPDPGGRYLSTAISFGDDEASVALALEVAPYFRLDPDRAASVLAEVAAAVSPWRAVAGKIGLSSREIEGMTPAFTALAEL